MCSDVETELASKGKIIGVKGALLEAVLPLGGLNDECHVITRDGRKITAEIVSFKENHLLISPFDDFSSVTLGDTVICNTLPVSVMIPKDPSEMILNALGKPYENSENLPVVFENKQDYLKAKINVNPPSVLHRKPINIQMQTGIRVIDTMTPIGYGQRIGLFASAGVGKSTLLTSISKNVRADICVIALIGERGREVAEFINDLGTEGLQKSVLVVSTSDELPSRRVLAAYTAQAIAEQYRKEGKNVLLLMDSLTRYSRAVRDVSLSAGELPVRQGYPVQVYQKLPQLLERAGNDNKGSITAIYTVLTNPDGTEDPLSDEIKSLLDGHIYLDSKLANQGIRPAIDLEKSISRLTSRLLTPHQIKLQKEFIKIFLRLKNEKDIVLFGGIPDQELSMIIQNQKQILDFINQSPWYCSTTAEAWKQLENLWCFL